MALADLDLKTEQGLVLVGAPFGPQALENARALFLEDRIDVAQFEEDVEAILRMGWRDDLDG